MKNNKKIIILSLMLSLNLYCLYLIDVDSFKIFGIAIKDYILLLDVLFGCYTLYRLKNRPDPKYKFKWFVFGYFIMSIVASISSLLIYKQPFLLGFRAQRFLLVSFALYFPLAKVMYYRLITKDDLIKVFTIVGLAQLFLFILNYFMSPNYSFLDVKSAKRYGDIRFYFNPILLDLLFFVELNNIVEKGFNIKKIYKHLIVMCLIIFEIIVVQKYRLTISGIMLVSFVVSLLSKASSSFKKSFILMALVFGVGFVLFTNMGSDIFNGIITGDIFTSKSAIARVNAQKYYLDKIVKYPITGTGFPNYDKSKAAYVFSGRSQNYYLSDNGLIAFTFMYGLIGTFGFLSLWFILLKNGFTYVKNNIIFFAFPLFLILTCFNELHWFWNYGHVVFILFIVLFEYTIMEKTRLS